LSVADAITVFLSLSLEEDHRQTPAIASANMSELAFS
jgi:hypothetical protein